MRPPLADQAVRERAASAADVNIVVTAGAGTGKTTLLIDRLTHLLLRPRQRVTINQIVALTFTNKAASEMKLRLRQRLLVMQDLARGASSQVDPSSYEARVLRDLQALYGVPDQHVAEIAEQTLHDLERARMETIHSFAAYVLRLFPIEAGVDPSFQEDDGTQFEAHFHQKWTQWLDRELGKGSIHRAQWRTILQLVSLDELRVFTHALMDELVPLVGLSHFEAVNGLSDSIQHWLVGLVTTGRALRTVYAKDQKLETLLDEAIRQLEALSRGCAADSEEILTHRSIPPQTKSWSDEDYEKAQCIIKVAKASRRLMPKELGEFLGLVLPFAEKCQQSFVKEGWVSFNGLLAKVRNLLRDSPKVRREIKSQFHAILVDEFQDTDPVQYELILYLAEEIHREVREWSHVRLEPGKLFIVGDPKQSIYAFRRADIEAYDSVIQDFVLGSGSGGEQLTLRSNFRSHSNVLVPVNACCREWFPHVAVKGVQPQYEDLLPVDSELAASAEEGVQVRIVRSCEEVVDADAATRAEAQELARWLAEEVFDRQQLHIKQVSVSIQPRHVAILFRTLTHLRTYVDALRQYGIPYVTEGEKHFYERQEIVDCIHLLRVLADPHDRLALVGVLRSPIGGCSDDVVATLLSKGHLDDWHRKPVSSDLPLIFHCLQDLRSEILRRPVADALDLIIRSTPLIELTAASMDGEQAVANVRKLEAIANEYAQRSGGGFRQVVETLTQWIHDPPPEAESSLVDDDAHSLPSTGAVRLMSIHKAKGLEFPMVILAGLHRGADPKGKSIWVNHDWLSDCLGMRLGSYYSLGGVFLETKMEARQRAEQIRLLYVAMTRAQRRLVLSAGLPTTSGASSRGMLGMIVKGLGIDVEVFNSPQQDSAQCTLKVGTASVMLEVVTASKEIKFGRQQNSYPWRKLHAEDIQDPSPWFERYAQMAEGYGRHLIVTPTRLGERKGEPMSEFEPEPVHVSAPPSHGPAGPFFRDRQALVGTLAHRVLQTWNFQDDPEKLPGWISNICTLGVPENWQHDVQGVTKELRDLFNAFVCTAPYVILRQAEILGREVPITVPWSRTDFSEATPGNGSPRVLHGVIDVVYRWQNQVWVGDYKTTAMSVDSMNRIVANYRGQAIAYREALQGVFGEMPVRAHLIFLRSGSSVEV
ncbi:UvrD-helicase domain-containing protein [Candidatus Nitronereus thalassa]|uniref:DNA 3'-5' helicase n=1 Tax=Candidatus Nitronereus thalassa TaxID=3020898 RepID=A0ABU3K6T6_9BACT|nr:UvrD-helicase domain-containing protein [Candidatus Nitronereus thalassa]MDT7042086.1 UvrD-helicase domain-containing protein [Candidatus Nitronereus thalassa]